MRDILSLRKKLANDGVQLATADAVEQGISINLKERDLTYKSKEAERSRAMEYIPNPGLTLMQNPFG